MRATAIGFLLSLTIASLACADGGFFPPSPKHYAGADLTEPSQRAVIVHRNGMETLFLFVDYHGGAKSFAWIVPTPAKPKVDVADPDIFKEMADYFHYLQLKAWKKAGGTKASGTMFDSGGSSHAGPQPAAPQVRIHLTRKIGPYEMTVLSSVDADALKRWLAANEFRVPEGVDTVLQAYVKEKWFFVAVKVQAETGRVTTLKPLRLDFRAKEVVYPIRISAANRGVTDVRVYLLERKRRPNRVSKQDPSGSAFWVGRSIRKRCPKLMKALPLTYGGRFRLQRIQEEFVPQIMRRMEDRIRPTTGPAVSLSRTLGIAEALLSANASEADWAAQRLDYYEGLTNLQKRRLPSAHGKAVAELNRKLNGEFVDRLVAVCNDFLGRPWSKEPYRPKSREEWAQARHEHECFEGAVELLASCATGSEAGVIQCLERWSAIAGSTEAAVRVLGQFETPAGRRALGRVAASQRHHKLAASLLVQSCLRGKVAKTQERYDAARDLVAVLKRGALGGTDRAEATSLLERCTERSFGDDWKEWKQWLDGKPG